MKNLMIFLAISLYLSLNFLQLNGLKRGLQKPTITVLSEKSQIVYLFFKVEKNNSGPERITLKEKKLTEGKLKSTLNFNENNGQEGDFIVSLTTTDGKEIVKQIVEDPLNPSREVYDEEKISRNKISLQNAEFSVRYSHSAEIQIVKIEKISKEGKQLIFTQRL